jgi:hypothetical protein
MVATILSDSVRDVPNFWASSSVSSVLVILCSLLAYARKGSTASINEVHEIAI